MKDENKTDYSNYRKGCAIAKDITTVMQSDKQQQLENYDELKSWLESNPVATESIGRLTNEQLYDSFSRQERPQETQRLLSTIRKKKSKIHVVRLIKYYVLSIASIVVVSLVTYQFIPEKTVTKEQKTLLSTGKIQLSPKTPTLVLNSGENIDLTSIDLTNYKINESKEKSIDQLIEQTMEYNTLLVPSKFTYDIVLDDGTRVFLNANSELRYPTEFKGPSREVFLTGEGYFEVKKGDTPFVVVVSNIKVKVYGTKFNINSYNHNKIQTVLIEGLIGVTIKNDSTYSELFVKPNQLLSVNSAGENSLVDVDSERYVTWLNGFIRSDEESMSKLLDNIAKWYGIEFTYTEDIERIKVSASLNRERPLDEILQALEVISGVKIVKKGEQKYMVL